jgi:glutamate-1-semialdehyde 2,1-aminomutase
MNLVKPTAKFISTLKNFCEDYKTLLIFDEVMTGFRVALGGARELLNIKADITILGKIIGGGMPLAGFGGRADIMDFLSPLGPVYQAGTLSGNPIALTCGLANLDLITVNGFYSHLTNMAKILTDGLVNLAIKHDIEFSADYIGGMFGFYFMSSIPINFKEVKTANNDKFKIFFHKMLEQGVYFAPSMYEANFLCIKHELSVIEDTLFKAERAFSLLADLK